MLAKALVGVFILCLALIGYTYAGYPVALWLATRRRDPPITERYETSFPSVTMVVPVHNEAAVIEQKVSNTEAIAYPGKFRCLFVSDSTDKTDEILERTMTERMNLLSLPERKGKSHAINSALSVIDSEVVVFSDANTVYERDAVTELVAPLADNEVGCVTGELRLKDDDDETVESTYWRYEIRLRRLEARLGTTVSINGGLLAFHLCDVDPLPDETLVDDLTLAMRKARNGQRIFFTHNAIGYERPVRSVLSGFTRRIRIGAGNYQILTRFADMVVPRRGHGLVSFMFVSHKVLRWLVPWLLLLAFVSSIALTVVTASLFLPALVIAQTLVYGIAVGGITSERIRSITPVRVITYLIVMNAALAFGSLRWLGGATTDIWTVTSREQ